MKLPLHRFCEMPWIKPQMGTSIACNQGNLLEIALGVTICGQRVLRVLTTKVISVKEGSVA